VVVLRSPSSLNDGGFVSPLRFGSAADSSQVPARSRLPRPFGVARILGLASNPAVARVAGLALAFFLTGTSMLLTSCGHRGRANPLDPLNESTRGSPPGFEVVALDGRVELRWSPLQLGGLTGYNIYRSQGANGLFELLGTSPYPSRLGSAIDSLLLNGTTYYYKLVPLIEGYGEGTPSPSLPATPGPHFAVAVDAFSGTVTKFSADLRAPVWTAGGFYYPFAVASDGQNVWVTDLYGGTICLAGDGKMLWSNTNFILPLAVSVRPDGMSAVADPNKGTVTILSPQGQVRAAISESLSAPASVSFGGSDEIWVADPRAGRVNKYSVDGDLLRSFAGCAEPRFLDAETADGSCWVIDVASNQVLKLSSDGQELLRVGPFSRSVTLAADESGGGCWVSDSATEEVVRISDRGEIVFRTGRVGRVASIKVLSDDGSAWLADEKDARVLVLSHSGKIISFATLPFAPTSVTVVGGR
jgi:sugar lactone lactonase YvrE